MNFANILQCQGKYWKENQDDGFNPSTLISSEAILYAAGCEFPKNEIVKKLDSSFYLF